MFKVNNRNTRTRGEICSKLTITIPERGQLRHSSAFVSHLVLVVLLLTLNMYLPAGNVLKILQEHCCQVTIESTL